MKKVFLFFLILSLIIVPTYAVNIFGVNFPSTKFGGYLVFAPRAYYSLTALSGFYQVGLPIKEVEGLYVMVGPEVFYASYTGINASFLALGINIDTIYLLKPWSFDLFGRKWYPSLNAALSVDILRFGFGTDYSHTIESIVDFDLYLGIYTPYGGKNSYLNVYFWIYPITIGFSFVSF
ncbi:MAG: hypothetical protein NZ841_01790 [Dictyoglomus sp.]|nr:hypothetical protein [Dictyoglomus sp.]MCX7942132.1 hypothetical protein [Dictyoglomaceae bacterium]MDW8188019.1 hypothetical protein [Dictyoglomus sp.]